MLCPRSGVGAVTTGPAAELQALVARIQTKLGEGKRSEAELAAELNEFDLLLARHSGQQTDAVAEILVQEATLYWHVLENLDKASQLVEKLKRDFPQTTPGRNADKMLAAISKHAEARRVQSSLTVGAALPDFEERDLNRLRLSLAQYRGKVVLLEFGAIWSKPWLAEVPNLREIYETYHPKGLEMIGVSLDQDRMRLSGFVVQKKLAWPRFCDGGGWNNKLALQYGVTGLPANFLLDREGKVVAKNLRGKPLAEAVAKTLSGQGQ